MHTYIYLYIRLSCTPSNTTGSPYMHTCIDLYIRQSCNPSNTTAPLILRDFSFFRLRCCKVFRSIAFMIFFDTFISALSRSSFDCNSIPNLKIYCFLWHNRFTPHVYLYRTIYIRLSCTLVKHNRSPKLTRSSSFFRLKCRKVLRSIAFMIVLIYLYLYYHAPLLIATLSPISQNFLFFWRLGLTLHTYLYRSIYSTIVHPCQTQFHPQTDEIFFFFLPQVL